MIQVPKSNQFMDNGETYIRDLYFPNVGTFIRLNRDLTKNNIKTLRKLAKGLGIPRFSSFNKSDLILEIQNRIDFL